MMRTPRPAGVYFGAALESFVLSPGEVWPCMRSEPESRHIGVLFTCLKTFAILSHTAGVICDFEVRDGSRVDKVAVRLRKGMNLLIYCVDNFVGRCVTVRFPDVSVLPCYTNCDLKLPGIVKGDDVPDLSYFLHDGVVPYRYYFTLSEDLVPSLEGLCRHEIGEDEITRFLPANSAMGYICYHSVKRVELSTPPESEFYYSEDGNVIVVIPYIVL